MTDEELYDQYHIAIERFFANKVATLQDVADLMHATFVRYFDKRRTVDIQHPDRYLFRIAKLVLFEYWRAKNRSNQHDEIGDHSVAAMGAGASTLLSERELHRIVLDSLRAVRLDYQIVLELHYWDDRSYAEIAALIDEGIPTIGTWMSRGRKALRKLVEAKLEDHPRLNSDDFSQVLKAVRESASSHAIRTRRVSQGG